MCVVENTLWRHNVTATIWEGEGVVDGLTLRVVVHDLKGVDKLCVALEVVYSRQDFLVEPVSNLEVS